MGRPFETSALTNRGCVKSPVDNRDDHLVATQLPLILRKRRYSGRSGTHTSAE